MFDIFASICPEASLHGTGLPFLELLARGAAISACEKPET